MEDTESSQRSRKRKAQENSLPEIDPKKASVDHYEKRIESLVLNNDALTHALEASHKTIHHQDKLITNLQMKLVSQFPRLIELRMEAMEKIIQQLTVMFEETKALVNSESFVMNSKPLPSNNRSLENDKVSHKEKESDDCIIMEPDISSTPIPNHSSKALQSDKTTAKTLHSDKTTSKTTTVLPSAGKNDIAKSKNEHKIPVEGPHDELMDLPPSTSKPTPSISRKKTTVKSPKVPALPKTVVPKRRLEQCKKVDTYTALSSSDGGDDDDTSLDLKKNRLKIKLQSQAEVAEKKKSKNESPTSDTKGKKTMNSSVEIVEVVDAKKTPTSLSVTNTESASHTLKDTLKTSDDNEIIPSKPSPSLPSIRSSKKRSTSSKPATRKKNSHKSKAKSSVKVKSSNDNMKDENEQKINGTISKKSNKSRKDSYFESLFSNVLKEPERKANVKKASSKSSGSSFEEASIDLINNQPQVVLMDIFTSTRSTANPLISKSREVFRSLSKHKADNCPLDRSSEDIPLLEKFEDNPPLEKSEDNPSVDRKKSLFSDSNIMDMDKLEEDVPPLDLELECVSEDDSALPSNSTKETGLTLNKTDANSILGLNENSSISPGFGFFQNSKDSSSDKSIDNGFNLDTIDQLLANVCGDDSCNKDFERDERLIYI